MNTKLWAEVPGRATCSSHQTGRKLQEGLLGQGRYELWFGGKVPGLPKVCWKVQLKVSSSAGGRSTVHGPNPELRFLVSFVYPEQSQMDAQATLASCSLEPFHYFNSAWNSETENFCLAHRQDSPTPI